MQQFSPAAAGPPRVRSASLGAAGSSSWESSVRFYPLYGSRRPAATHPRWQTWRVVGRGCKFLPFGRAKRKPSPHGKPSPRSRRTGHHPMPFHVCSPGPVLSTREVGAGAEAGLGESQVQVGPPAHLSQQLYAAVAPKAERGRLRSVPTRRVVRRLDGPNQCLQQSTGGQLGQWVPRAGMEQTRATHVLLRAAFPMDGVVTTARPASPHGTSAGFF